MNYYAWGALSDGLICLFCSATVYLKNPRGTKNWAFQPFVLSGAVWCFFYVAWQTSTSPEQALFYIRLSMIGAVFLPVTNLHYILKVLDLETPARQKFKYILFFIALLTVSFAPTPYFIPRVEPKLDFPFWPVPGPMMHSHFIILMFPSLYTLYLIWQKKEHSSPLNRNKLKWLFIAHLIGYTGGVTNNFLWYDIPVRPYLSPLAAITPMMMTSLFFRLAVVDFNYLIRKAVLYFLSLAGTVSLIAIAAQPFKNRIPLEGLIAFAALLGIFIYPMVKKWIEFLMLLIRKRGGLNSNSIDQKREKIKESTYTYRDLAQNLVDLARTTFPIDVAAVYFYDITRREFILSAQKGMKNPMVKNLLFNRQGLAISPADPLIQLLEKKNELLNMEALLNEDDKPETQPLVESMQRLESELCAPFVIGGKLRGFFALGRKTDNALFDEDELETFKSFSQMGLEIMRYITSMETELNHTALYSHDMNHDIRSIMQTIQFLHSPMAKTAPPERLESLLSGAERVAENLFQSFQTNRDRSVLIMKIIRGDYEKKEVNISRILKNSTEKFSLQAEKSGVAYLVNIETMSRPVLGNEEDLTRVIDNLISNAFRYVPESGAHLAVTGRTTDKGYEITVKDNGDGIDPENLENIWKVGWQAKDVKKGAAGLGLAIVKQIIQVHNGTIIADSKGKETGTVFQLTLPFDETNPLAKDSLRQAE